MFAAGPSRRRQADSSRGAGEYMLKSNRGAVNGAALIAGKGSTADGRSGLRRGVCRRVPGARVDVARIGAAVSGTGVLANVVGGVLALLLIVYLFVALVKPEKF